LTPCLRFRTFSDACFNGRILKRELRLPDSQTNFIPAGREYYGEADTRGKLIDPVLHDRGWTEENIRRGQTHGGRCDALKGDKAAINGEKILT
jgi:hypothetical protein